MKKYPWLHRDFEQSLSLAKRYLEKSEANIYIEKFNVSEESRSIENGRLNGALISIKDTFDVKGYKTTAGSVFLPKIPASDDAVVVKKLRDQGAILLGHTNMTELAYSGLGLNPHYGTPMNPIFSGCIPGGSTSGGAVSVASGVAEVAIGTDTGGSLRIPAAFCGLVGFKPSQQTVSLQGCKGLSKSLDSVGAMAKSVSECREVLHIISESQEKQYSNKNVSLQVVIPENFGFDDMDSETAMAFQEAVNYLKQSGIEIRSEAIPLMEVYKKLPVWQFSSMESRQIYGDEFDLTSVTMDERVRARIARSDNLSNDDYLETCRQRAKLKDDFQRAYPNTVFLMPTVAIQPPRFSELELDSEFDRINLLCLRNTSLANVIDGCSISLPFWHNQQPTGVMLTAQNGQDHALLDVAEKFEAIFYQ